MHTQEQSDQGLEYWSFHLHLSDALLLCESKLLRFKTIMIIVLTLKAPNDIHKYFFHCFSEKIRLDVSSESSARQRIYMKNEALFSSKDEVKN